MLALAGLVVLAALYVVPWHALLPGPFSVHMLQHIGVVAIVAPLLALGMARGRFDLVRRAPAAFSPIALSIVELVVVWVWHAPALHRAAHHSAFVTSIEQVTFLASGLAVWLSAFGGDPRDIDRRASGLVALLLTSMHMTLLGALLALSPRAVYTHATLTDQHFGGAFMLLVGGVAYLAGGLRLSFDLLRLRGARP